MGMRCVKLSHPAYFVWTVFWVLIVLKRSHAGSFPWSSASSATKHVNVKQNTTWTSMLTVDPCNIVTLMVRYGGLLMTKEYEKDVKVLAKVCHAEKVELNPVEKVLLIHNFTIHTPNEDDALRIGEVLVRWDSYLRPCVEVKVTDVYILVEFWNAMLTKNNWGELYRFGFPPEFKEDSDNEGEGASSTFLRVGSVDLSGNVTACVKYRGKNEIVRVQWGLDVFSELDRKIKNKAEENLATLGRRGCMTTELFDLLKSFFGDKTKDVLKNAANDVIQGGGDTIQEVSRLVDSAKGKVVEHCVAALDDISEQSQETLVKGILKFRKTLDKINDDAMDAVRILNATRSDRAKNAGRRIQDILNSNSFLQRQP